MMLDEEEARTSQLSALFGVRKLFQTISPLSASALSPGKWEFPSLAQKKWCEMR